MAFGDKVSAQNVFGRDMVLGNYNLQVKIYFAGSYEFNHIEFEIVDKAVDPSCIDVETTPPISSGECIDQVPWL